MRHARAILGTILGLLCGGCICALDSQSLVLGTQFTRFDKKEVLRWKGQPYFYASALCVHSSYVVDKVRVRETDGSW